jgi:hypothetical protein
MNALRAQSRSFEVYVRFVLPFHPKSIAHAAVKIENVSVETLSPLPSSLLTITSLLLQRIRAARAQLLNSFGLSAP